MVQRPVERALRFHHLFAGKPKWKINVYNELRDKGEKDTASSTENTLKSPGDCVFSKDQRDCGLLCIDIRLNTLSVLIGHEVDFFLGEDCHNIHCLDTTEFIDKVCSLRGMNKEESKAKVGINYGKPFLKVSSKTMVDFYNDFKLHQSSPSGSAFKFSPAKRMLLQAPETNVNRQENVYFQRLTRFWTTYSPAV